MVAVLHHDVVEPFQLGFEKLEIGVEGFHDVLHYPPQVRDGNLIFRLEAAAGHQQVALLDPHRDLLGVRPVGVRLAAQGGDVLVVGGALFTTLARFMGWNGRLLPIGFTSGQIPSVPMNLPLLKNYSIVGVFAGAWAEKFPEQAVRMNDTLAQLLAEGKIHPHIDRVLPLEQVKEAMRAVANRTVQGRIVLKIK